MRWLGFLLIVVGLIGCDVLDNRIGEPDAEDAATPQAFSSATPGGRISVWMDASPVPNSTFEGDVLPPAATATSFSLTAVAATATASAPTPQPAFLQSDCPLPLGVTPPARPLSFTDFPDEIGVFLSNGGQPSVLENTLRNWGTITEQGGLVQANTDLTGDGIPEILVVLFNPTTYNPEAVLNAGQLLVYGCDNDAYRLLYRTPNNPGLSLPVLHRVGDMNADVKAELVFDIQSCTTGYCTREGFVLAWNPVLGLFESMNNGQILSINGRLGIVDIDSDGILEITVGNNQPPSPVTGPTRGVVDVWDWTGVNYVLATRLPDDPFYRIHAVHDADNELLTGNVTSALRAYLDIRENEELITYSSVANEFQQINAYLLYRIITAYARDGDDRAERFLATLLSEAPLGLPGSGFTAMAQAFMDVYRATQSASAGCQAAQAAITPDVFDFLNGYGTANRTYSPFDLCPF